MRRIVLAGVVLAALAARARAQTQCASLPNPTYLQIGDTQEPLIKRLGKNLRESTVPGVATTLVYIKTGSCTNVTAMYSNTKMTGNALFIPTQTEVAGWTPQMDSPPCALPAGGASIDIANSNIFVAACPQAPPRPADVQVILGPVQSYVFAVHRASNQNGITAEQAYFVFGFPMGGMASPWTIDTLKWIRTTTKSTLVSMAAAIKVPVNKWKGNMLDQSDDVVRNLMMATNTEQTIGILGSEILDQQRATLKALAYRAYGQYYAYYPDSTETAKDKANVRDGHYTIWSPTVYLARNVTGTTMLPAKSQYIIDLILGKTVTPDPQFNPLDFVINVGLVPDCAMRVTRSVEAGDMSRYDPSEPCHCFFESRVLMTASPPGCTACTTSCATGVCRRGFCEAR